MQPTYTETLPFPYNIPSPLILGIDESYPPSLNHGKPKNHFVIYGGVVLPRAKQLDHEGKKIRLNGHPEILLDLNLSSRLGKDAQFAYTRISEEELRNLGRLDCAHFLGYLTLIKYFCSEKENGIERILIDGSPQGMAREMKRILRATGLETKPVDFKKEADIHNGSVHEADTLAYMLNIYYNGRLEEYVSRNFSPDEALKIFAHWEKIAQSFLIETLALPLDEFIRVLKETRVRPSYF